MGRFLIPAAKDRPGKQYRLNRPHFSGIVFLKLIHTRRERSARMSDAGRGNFLQNMWKEGRAIIITFLVLFLITMPCCCFLGYRTNWILWQLGLR